MKSSSVMDSKTAETLLQTSEEAINSSEMMSCGDKDSAEHVNQQGMSDGEKNYSDMFRGHDHDLDDIDSGDDLDDDDMLMDMENKHGNGSSGAGGSGGYGGSGRQYGSGASASSSGGFMEDDKRKRRAIANSNERRRMQSINAGFQTLKSLIPHSSGEKLSKACILQRSADFMKYLSGEKEKLNSKMQIALKLLETNGLLSLYQSQVSSELGLSLSAGSVSMSGPSASSKPSSTKINKQPTISNISAIATTNTPAAAAKNQTTILQPVSLNETINSSTEASGATEPASGGANPVSPYSKQAGNALLTPIAPNKSMPAPIVLSRKSTSSLDSSPATKINTMLPSSGATPAALSPTIKGSASPSASTSPGKVSGKSATTSGTTTPAASSSVKLNELISTASTSNAGSNSIASLIQQQQQQTLPINRKLTDTTNIKQHNQQLNVLTPASTGGINSFLINSSSGTSLINVANTMLINNPATANPDGLVIGQTPLLSTSPASQADELKSHAKNGGKKKSTGGSCQSILNTIRKSEANVDILKLIDLKSNPNLDLASVPADALKSLISGSSTGYLSIPIITSSLQQADSDATDEQEKDEVKQETEADYLDENETDAYETMDEESGVKTAPRCYQTTSSQSGAKSSLTLQPQQHARIMKSSRSNSIDQLIAAAAVTAIQSCSSTATSPSPSPSSPSPSTSSVASSTASTLINTPSTGVVNSLVQPVPSSQANPNSTTNNAPSPSSSCSSTSSNASSKQQQQQQQSAAYSSSNDRNFSRKGLNTIVEAIIHVEGKNLLDELVESASPTSSTTSTHSSSSTSSLTGLALSAGTTAGSTRYDESSPTSALKNMPQQQQQQKPPKKRKYTTEDMASQSAELASQTVPQQAYHYISDYYNNSGKALLSSGAGGSANAAGASAQMCFIDINQLGTLLLPNASAKSNPIVLNGDQVLKAANATTINFLPNDISLMLTSASPLSGQPIAALTTADHSGGGASRRADTNNNSSLMANNNGTSTQGSSKSPASSLQLMQPT